MFCYCIWDEMVRGQYQSHSLHGRKKFEMAQDGNVEMLENFVVLEIVLEWFG